MKCEECGFEFHRLRCTGCGTPIGERILIDNDDQEKEIIDTAIAMIESIHSDVETIKKQLKGKELPIDEEVSRAHMLNALYTDMDCHRKYVEDIVRDRELLERLKRWCSALEMVLREMGIGTFRT